jgi:hypothetical protein
MSFTAVGGTLTAKTGTPSVGSATLFPLLGNLCIGFFDLDVPATQQWVARFDVCVTALYLGWDGNSGEPGGQPSTPAAAIAGIKSHNPNIKMGNYTCFVPVGGTVPAEETYAKTQKGPSGIGDWMAYNAAGTVFPLSTNGNGNTTLLVTPDSNGYHLPEYCAHYDYSSNGPILSTSGGAVPSWDIWYNDDNFYQPRIAADWNRSGTNWAVNSTNARNWWRAGQAAYYTTASAIKPSGMVFMINADSNLDGPHACGDGWSASLGSEYQNICGGALLEALIGETWSVESQSGANGGTGGLMNWYTTVFANLIAPKMVMFCHDWTTNTNAGPNTASGYQEARYGLAACLMGNGYFTLADENYSANNGFWLDEYTAGAGYSTPSSTKWLGAAIDPPQFTSWSNGVWMRRFANGIALMNPKSNGSQTVTPPGGPGYYHHFTGSQAPTINNGASVTGTVTLADRDGLLLVKT